MKLTRIAVLAGALMIAAAPLKAEVIQNEVIEIPFFAFISCADNDNGEFAVGLLELHFLVRENFDAAGGAHTGVLIHPLGGTLMGEVTGDTYRAVGRTGDSFNVGAGGLPITSTFVNQFKMVGTGGGAKLTVHQTLHFTVNANGDTTAEVSNVRITCK